MSNIILPVELLPGTTIDEAYSETIALADQLNLRIRFRFNGTLCMARPGDDAAWLAAEWQRKEDEVMARAKKGAER